MFQMPSASMAPFEGRGPLCMLYILLLAHDLRYGRGNLLDSKPDRRPDNPPCPPGLHCGGAATVPAAQPISYLGTPGACDAAVSTRLHSTGLFQPRLDSETGPAYTMIGHIIPGVQSKYETAVLVRAKYYQSIVMHNVMTAFRAKALPYAYASGFGLPFSASERKPDADVRFRNTALAYALLRMSAQIAPAATDSLGQFMSSSLGLDPSYTSYSDLSKAQDIGNAAGYATAATAAADGWNSNGDLLGNMPFSDFTGYVPSNSPYQLTDITAWQPLYETDRTGYFWPQTHTAAQLRTGKVQPFGAPASEFYGMYASRARQPYPPQEQLTNADLAAYAAQADAVIAASASLTDTQKALAELWDNKVRGFTTVQTSMMLDYKKGNITMFDIVELGMIHVPLYDATLAMWYLKLKFNAVRPITAIHYLYNDTDITAYAGPFKGTRTIKGRNFVPYLRTMPHADYPSGTACICVTASEWWQEFTAWAYGTPGFAYYFTVPPRCSIVEPGVTPATTVNVSYTSLEAFIADCAWSRVWAGVHFPKSVDASTSVCRGMGTAAWHKFMKLMNGAET